MSEEWAIGARRPSTISDWKKLIKDFRDQFPYDPLTALIVETFANALDARATQVDIKVDDDVYEITDNGKGMTAFEFKEYHNIASLTKRRGEGIGFAGVGAKIFLDRAWHIITETKFKGLDRATYWAFHGESLEWEPIVTPNKLRYPTGTCVEVKLKDKEDISKRNPQFLEKTLQQYYNATLLGYYRLKNVTINGKKAKPWQVPEKRVEKRKNFEFKYGGHRIRGFFIKSTNAIDEEFQGPFIVVHGKTVMNWWFRQYPLGSENLHGLILADHLIDILRTSKSDFERTSMIWKKFHGKAGRVFSDWLDEIGARPQPPAAPTDLDRVARDLEKTVNEVLKMPELADLANTIFQNIVQREVAIRSKSGELLGSETEGKQTTTGTIGGLRKGKGVDTAGDEEGTGTIEDEDGISPIERVKRRVKGGIRVGYDDKPGDPLEGWIDPGKQTIILNREHPAWKVSEALCIQSRAEHVRVYHMLRVVFSILIEEAGVESPRETSAKLFSCWYNRWIKG